MVEKIKVNLSYNVYNLLIKDMEDFHFDVKDDTPNKNLFYNTIIKNMFEKHKKEEDLLRDKLSTLLDNKIKSNTLLNEILDELEELYNYKIEDKTNRSHGYYISFRPSKKMEEIYDEIELNYLKNNTFSNYFRNIFNEYSKLSQDERERIIFKDQLKLIESAINNKKYLNVKLKNNSFEFIPYKVVRTNDELYNYVVGAIRKNNILHYLSLHLFKCDNIIKSKKTYELSEEEISYFDNVLIYGPREIERRTITTKIKLTKNGIRRFKTFYLNRPIPTEINDNIYVFNSSHENLFVYFSRFGSDAEIIEPLNFRNQMINFHKKAYNKYLNE